jgi:hypothetical protein
VIKIDIGEFRMKKLIRIEVEQLQTEGSVADLIIRLSALAAKHTSGFLTYEVETVTAYDDSWAELTVYLSREETDLEYSQRLEVEKERARIQEDRERNEFERLKLKFNKPDL